MEYGFEYCFVVIVNKWFSFITLSCAAPSFTEIGSFFSGLYKIKDCLVVCFPGILLDLLQASTTDLLTYKKCVCTFAFGLFRDYTNRLMMW